MIGVEAVYTAGPTAAWALNEGNPISFITVVYTSAEFH